MISQLLKSVYHVLDLPNYNKDYLSEGQLSSKEWLIDELLKLHLELGTVYLCAGWYGSLATLMLESNLNIDVIRSFDIDRDCALIADTINRPWVIDNWRFKASTVDIVTMTYPTTYVTSRVNGTTVTVSSMPHTIINTSCEHIPQLEHWYNNIPMGTIVILQSNDYFEIPEHVQCVNDLQEFELLTPMTETLYSGVLSLSKYNRFMRIGIK